MLCPGLQFRQIASKLRILITSWNGSSVLILHCCRAAYKLHKDFAKTYSELSLELREQIDSVEWATVAENFGFQRLPSCRASNLQ